MNYWALLNAVMQGAGMGQQQAGKPIDEAAPTNVGSSVQTELPSIYNRPRGYQSGGFASQLMGGGYQPKQYSSPMSFDPLGIQGADLAPTMSGSSIPKGETNPFAADTGGGK